MPATLVAQMRAVLPRVVLTGGEASKLDFEIHSNTYDNKYPPDARATFRVPLPGQTPNSPMMSEFFAGGFVLGKAENLVGRVRPGNVSVVVWAFLGPEGAFRGLRALRDLSGLHVSASPFAPGAILLSLPGTGVSDLIWVHGRALVRASAGDAQGGASMAHQRDRVARAIDAKIGSEPSVGGVELPPEPRARHDDARRPAGLAARRRERPAGRSRHAHLDAASPGPTRAIRCTTTRPPHGSCAAIARSGCSAASRRSSRWRRSTATTRPMPGRSRARRLPARRCARPGASAGVRVTRAPVVRGAVRVVRPGKRLLDDLFWVRGSVLLQVGAYGPPDIPLLQSRQALVARALDANASALR